VLTCKLQSPALQVNQAARPAGRTSSQVPQPSYEVWTGRALNLLAIGRCPSILRYPGAVSSCAKGEPVCQ
jgi:hypothetical protein